MKAECGESTSMSTNKQKELILCTWALPYFTASPCCHQIPTGSLPPSQAIKDTHPTSVSKPAKKKSRISPSFHWKLLVIFCANLIKHMVQKYLVHKQRSSGMSHFEMKLNTFRKINGSTEISVKCYKFDRLALQIIFVFLSGRMTHWLNLENYKYLSSLKKSSTIFPHTIDDCNCGAP